MGFIRNRSAFSIFSIFKSATRTFSAAVDTQKVSLNENSQHIYRKTFTKLQLIDHMISSIIYNKDGIIVLDKPYGIGHWRDFEVKNIRSNYHPKTFETLSLKDVLDEMASKLGYEALTIKKGPDRYSSGLLFLTADEKAEKKLTSFIWRADSFKTPYTYLIVTCGNPCRSSGSGRYGLKLDKELNCSVFVNEWSINSQKRGEVFGLNVCHEVLSSSESASLVRVKLNTYKHNALRLYMVAKCLSPILGDDRFGSRVVKMGDTSVDLGPENPQSKRRQKLPVEILEALKLQKHESDVVPVHMHLYSFPFYSKGLKHCTNLQIPLPEWFIWTCCQLKLDVHSVIENEINSLSK